MFTRGNLRRQHDQALVNDPALQQHYFSAADKEIFNHLRNKHFGATGPTMKRGNHEVAVFGPDDLKNDAMLRDLIDQACGACDVTPFDRPRLVWYSGGNSIHKPHHDPTGGQVQPIVALITNQRDVLA
jgi:hypothetical protein